MKELNIVLHRKINLRNMTKKTHSKIKELREKNGLLNLGAIELDEAKKILAATWRANWHTRKYSVMHLIIDYKVGVYYIETDENPFVRNFEKLIKTKSYNQ